MKSSMIVSMFQFDICSDYLVLIHIHALVYCKSSCTIKKLIKFTCCNLHSFLMAYKCMQDKHIILKIK
ncbi:hypothetical protein CUMW_283050, partial [Citrus unshiu]